MDERILLDSLGRLVDLVSDHDQEEISYEISKIIKKYNETEKALEFGTYWLNSVAVGLGRWFDESFQDWRYIGNMVELVTSIVLNAAENLTIQLPTIRLQRCGKHEDGACEMSVMTPRYIIKHPKPHGQINFDLMPDQAVNFLPDPEPKPCFVLKNEKIFRIFDLLKSFPTGCWWIDELPKGKKDWRSKAAVLRKWNQDKYYIECLGNGFIPAWIGKASSQKVVWKNNNIDINEVCILRGGGLQILLPPTPISINLKSVELTKW